MFTLTHVHIEEEHKILQRTGWEMKRHWHHWNFSHCPQSSHFSLCLKNVFKGKLNFGDCFSYVSCNIYITSQMPPVPSPVQTPLPMPHSLLFWEVGSPHQASPNKGTSSIHRIRHILFWCSQTMQPWSLSCTSVTYILGPMFSWGMLFQFLRAPRDPG